jgi:manganese/iron transport system permease protein
MLVVATAVTLGAMLTGVWISFHLDSAPAPTIILVLTSIFIAALLRHNLRLRRG